MRIYSVIVPIAGHAVIEVEAENEDDAKEQALCSVTNEHLEDWEPMEQFTRGNVCYCPSPWEIEAVDVGAVDNDEATAPAPGAPGSPSNTDDSK